MDYQPLIEATGKFIARTHMIDRNRIVVPAQRKIAKAYKGIFAKQKKIFIAKFSSLEKLFAESTADELARMFAAMEDATEADMIVALTGNCGAITDAAAKSMLAQMANFELANPLAVEYLDGMAAKSVTAISETTRSQIGSIITNGVDRGWSYNKTGKLLREAFDGFSRYRSELIASNEARGAYEWANLETGRYLADSGLEMEKSWSTTGDDAVTEECAANEDMGWIPLEDDFDSGDETPPRFPGCRCSCLYQRVGAVQ